MGKLLARELRKNMTIDIKRTEYLKERGYRVIRFWNNDVLKETEAVLNSILLSLSDNIPSPLPSPRGRGNLIGE
jgi:very-short-patch-repair endonuclease